MIPKEAIEAALTKLKNNYRPISEAGKSVDERKLVTEILTAAFAAMPAQVVVAQNEWLKTRLADLQLPSTKRDHDTREKWFLHCGMPDASTTQAAPSLAAENERLRAALEGGGE